MSSLAALSQEYAGSSDGDDADADVDIAQGSAGSKFPTSSLVPSTSSVGLNLAPALLEKNDSSVMRLPDLKKDLTFNPKYDQLFGTPVGPNNPFKSESQNASKNMLTGFVEGAHVSEFCFETQRRTFESYGYARDPSADAQVSNFVGNAEGAAKSGEVTVFEKIKKRNGDKRQRHWNLDSTDVDGYTGPWGGFVDEQRVAKPNAETLEEMANFMRKKKKMSKVTRTQEVEETSILHINDPHDYQGRSFINAPHDVGVNLRSEAPPDKCFVPKKQIHTWAGHTKPVQAIRWFPKTAHLLLSCSSDCKVKLWEVYKGRRCVRTYSGHKLGLLDTCFNTSGDEFATASFDRYVKIWDTETGQCKHRLTTGKTPRVVKYNPDEDKQHMILAGLQDKKIVQWDLRSGEIAQEYDRHMGAVNTITFFDQNRRFCTTSDDKSLRIWEWEIPVDTKVIQDPSMHAMPTCTMSPNQRWLACQSHDNKVVIFQVVDDKIRHSRKKNFKGHMVSGYACGIDFSPDMSYLVSGDADGKACIWDWKTHRIVAKWKAHDNVCKSVLWHPHETSKLATCGWDGTIKFWD